MIEKLYIKGYRKFREITVLPRPGFNILVGENESGKSTLMEAVTLGLTGRVNGRPASEELNHYWFNQEMSEEFFAQRRAGMLAALPEIEIEIFLADREEFQRQLHGAHNSERPVRACCGVRLRVHPNSEYSEEIEAYLRSGTTLLPVEYYSVEWRSFGDVPLTARPKELTIAVIDSKTIRSTSGVDYHLRQMMNDHLEPRERAAVSLAYRSVKESMTHSHLLDINTKMAEMEGALDDGRLSLAMDQSSRSGWDSNVVPHVANIPFSMSGNGQQAAVKIALSMGQRANSARVVMIEEPENHLSHTSLNRLLRRIGELAGPDQQLLVSTHSSFVLNRLGLDGLTLMSEGRATSFSALSTETVAYFKKLPGYDTLRMVLADRFVLVEGPSDEILFERFYLDHVGRRPVEDGVDVVSMRGVSLRRSLELARALGKRCAGLRDNDGIPVQELIEGLGDLVSPGLREIFIGDPRLGKTLEPQIMSANGVDDLREVLGVQSRTDLATWMSNNKTEGALRIAESPARVNPPKYFVDAIKFISEAR